MKILKNKFNLSNVGNLDPLGIDIGKFPGGEMRVKLFGIPSEEVHVEAVLTSSDDVMTLVMLEDALRRAGVEKIRLTMPYIPYARQDRVCNKGESLSIKAFANIINSLKFSSIIVYDPHSDVACSVIDRCIAIPSHVLIKQHDEVYHYICQKDWEGKPFYLVSPDAGSVKKSYEIAKAFPQINGIIFAEKVRDVATGKITKTVVHDVPNDIAEARLLLCDDICDGGRTFIELGKVLQCYSPKEMCLYVTHGIFSQGKHVLLKPTINDSCVALLGTYDVKNEICKINNSGPFDNVWSTIDFTEYK